MRPRGDSNAPYKLTNVVKLPTARIHSLQQLINFIIAHFLAQVRQDISELSHADETRQILVEHLETATVLFRLAGIAEAAGSVEDTLEGIEIDCCKELSVGEHIGREFPNCAYSLRQLDPRGP